MKKLLLCAAFAVFAGQQSYAQIEKGNSLVSANVGVGSTFAASGATASLPFGVSYEYAFNDKMTAGAFAMYAGAKWDNAWAGKDWKWNYLFVGALYNYHFVNDEKWDVYAGGRLGFINVSFDDGGTGITSPSTSGVGYAIQGGARYFFSKNFAANAELGYGFSYLRLGLTYKL